MRSLSVLLLAAVLLPLSLPRVVLAQPAGARAAPDGTADAERRALEAEEQRVEHERNRLERAARIQAAQEAARQEQRDFETYQEESLAAARRRIGKMGLAMAATTGALTGVSWYLDRRHTRAGGASYRPITQGLAGFTAVTGLLGAGFLISGLLSDSQPGHDLALAPTGEGGLTAALGWRF